MRAPTIVALSTLSLALFAATAHADETAPPPAAARRVIMLDVTRIKVRVPRPQVAIDISKLVQRTPLPELRQPLVERIGAAVEKDPF